MPVEWFHNLFNTSLTNAKHPPHFHVDHAKRQNLPIAFELHFITIERNVAPVLPFSLVITVLFPFRSDFTVDATTHRMKTSTSFIPTNTTVNESFNTYCTTLFFSANASPGSLRIPSSRMHIYPWPFCPNPSFQPHRFDLSSPAIRMPRGTCAALKHVTRPNDARRSFTPAVRIRATQHVSQPNINTVGAPSSGSFESVRSQQTHRYNRKPSADAWRLRKEK